MVAKLKQLNLLNDDTLISGNMKRLSVNILIFAFFTSCGERQSNRINVHKTDSGISQITINDPKVPSKKKSISIRDFGQGIIDGKIEPEANNETIACLDSIDDKNAETRQFYFQVYRVIAKKSDGALSEIIGSYTKTYLQICPKEALNNYIKFDTNEKNIFVDNLAYEFYASGLSYREDIDNYFALIYDNCKDCIIEEGLVEDLKYKLTLIVAKANE
jgi:hypothetical protein